MKIAMATDLTMSLADSSARLGLLSDPTRLRLLSLLAREELSVAELTRVTELSQSRVSTHLGKLREADLVSLRRDGPSTYYRLNPAMPADAKLLWGTLSERLDDSVLSADREQLARLIRAREQSWPDSVAGRMERHYSPGRTWEATARGLLGLVRLGDVLDAGSGDGTIAALLAPRARSVTCLDRSDKVLEAARRRLAGQPGVRLCQGDLLELPFEDESYDAALLFNVLTYVSDPALALSEAGRILRPGGLLATVTLRRHGHLDATAAYGHVRDGFDPPELRAMIEAASLTVDACEVTSRERRKPHFEVITAFAHRAAIHRPGSHRPGIHRPGSHRPGIAEPSSHEPHAPSAGALSPDSEESDLAPEPPS